MTDVSMPDGTGITRSASRSDGSAGVQIVFFNLLDVYHTPPESGELQYK